MTCPVALYTATNSAGDVHFHLINPAWNNRGSLLHELQRFDKALEGYAKVLNNHGNILQALGRLDEAVANYDRALALESKTAPSSSPPVLA